ncbi:MAG: hypothetical protein AB7V58_05985 [Solirubrobacterales bacterium]
MTITAEQRDALYDQIVDRLSGIGDVWLAASARDFEGATRLGREFCDDLGLVLDDLGFGEGSGEAVELRTPPAVLRRVLSRLCASAIGQDRAEAPEREAAREMQERNRLVVQTCQTVLARIASG